MKFYNRTNELNAIKKLAFLSKDNAQFLYISGRRRIGKTTLLREFLSRKKGFYLFVSRETKEDFLASFSRLVSNEPVFSSFTKFETLDHAFEFLFTELLPKKEMVILDEFQNGFYISQNFFSLFQKHWDKFRENSNGFLITCGSMQTLMHTVFEDKKEPLYKRATAHFILNEFSPLTLYEMVKTEFRKNDTGHFLNLYSVFGGIPFYYYLIKINGLDNLSIFDIIQEIVLKKYGILYNEGKDLTIEALGKKHSIFFSILISVASGCTRNSEILNATGQNSGTLEKYLHQLVEDYRFLTREKSILSKHPSSKTTRYSINDNFLTFWFRYVYKNISSLEIERDDEVLRIIKEDFSRYNGHLFEKCIKELLIELNSNNQFVYDFHSCGRFFNQKQVGEIDLILLNNRKKRMALCECKLNLNSCNIDSVVNNLKSKIPQNTHYKVDTLFLFSAENISKKTKSLIHRNDTVKAFSLSDLIEMGL